MAQIGYGLVRGSDGKPKFDGDPNTYHPAILSLLTSDEKTELGVWTGPMARDAEGTKRLTPTTGGYTAEDRLVAVSEIFDGSSWVRLPARVDVSQGAKLTVEGM